ncbi:hypothetical protein AAEU23_004795, partial [Escherichia coli]
KYQQTVLPLRNGILRALLEGAGATGMNLFTLVVSDRIGYFYFTGPLPAGWRKRDDMAFIGKELCFAARPDKSCPEGQAIAAMVEAAERELKKYPDFLSWLCEQLGIMRFTSLFNSGIWWAPAFSRDGLCVVFKADVLCGEINVRVPDECQEIKYSEYVALTEE